MAKLENVYRKTYRLKRHIAVSAVPKLSSPPAASLLPSLFMTPTRERCFSQALRCLSMRATIAYLPIMLFSSCDSTRYTAANNAFRVKGRNSRLRRHLPLQHWAQHGVPPTLPFRISISARCSCRL